MNWIKKNKLIKYLPFFICVLFFTAYTTLSIVKHNNFLTGYDLAIYEQAVWKYSQFKNPITTVHAFYDKPIYYDHFEPILLLISPLYWFFDSTWILLVIQTAAVSITAYIIFLLARLKKVKYLISLALLISFLMFYGIQNAVWADFHTLVLALPFLALFIYFIELNKYKYAAFVFFFAIICKEDIALFTFVIALTQFVVTRKRALLYFIVASILYMFFVFGIFFPSFAEGYRFQNSEGLVSNIDLTNFANTQEKRDAIFYSLASYGFIPLLAPIYLLVAIADLGHYFILGSDYVSSAQGIFMHYRSSLALFLIWPVIIAISKFRKLNNNFLAIYLLGCILIVQYVLHLPLSYLSKSWFWQENSAVQDIKQIINKIPADSSIVTQVNISPHISHRNDVYLIWPESKEFKENSPCGQELCNWARWAGNPQYLLIDTSAAWDTRHLLTNREEFARGIDNLEKENIITEELRINNSVIYKINKAP